MPESMEIVQVREKLYERRRSQRRWGLGLGGLGFLTIIDFWSPLPIPLVGFPALFLGTLALGTGLFFLYRQQELPMSEALDIASLYNGFLSGPLLIRSLHVTPDTAERILGELVARGYAVLRERGLEEGELTYRVMGLEPRTTPDSSPRLEGTEHASLPSVEPESPDAGE